MKKLSLILILFIQFVANAQTLLSQFNIKESDPNLWVINGGYSYGFEKNTTIISKDGQHQINIPRNPSDHFGKLHAYDGKYIACVTYGTWDYTISVYNEKGILLKQTKLPANLKNFLPIPSHLNEKGKVEVEYVMYLIKTIHVMDDKVFLEFSRVRAFSPAFSPKSSDKGGYLLIADINEPALKFKYFEPDYPKSELAQQPDLHNGWIFFKMQNHLLYFYRSLMSNPFKNSGKMFYEIVSSDLNGKVKTSFYTSLTTDNETEMKYDAGCYIPEFDTSHFYILRNFEYHTESGKNKSGWDKQRLGFEVVKCRLNNGEILWSKYVDYIDEKKNHFSGFSGNRMCLPSDYCPEFPIEVICRFNKIIVRKWTIDGSFIYNNRMITMFDTSGNILVNKVMTESQKEMKKNYLTEFQDEDIKDISYYDGWKKLKTESKLSIDNIPYFNPDNFYLVGYDEKLRKCYIYK